MSTQKSKIHVSESSVVATQELFKNGLANPFNPLMMSSREISELTGKQHKNVLVDCDNLNKNYTKMGMAEISAMNYKSENGQYYREYLLTRMQTLDLMTGYSIELRIKVNRRWEELEKSKPIDSITRKDLAKMLLESEEEKEKMQLTIETQSNELKIAAPKVIFADSVSASKTTILIGELAKILKQNGINMGQNRLFEWLRENGYLISRKGSDFNLPTQRSMELGLFEIKETVVTHSDGHITVNKTTKVNGKAQIYFMNNNTSTFFMDIKNNINFVSIFLL